MEMVEKLKYSPLGDVLFTIAKSSKLLADRCSVAGVGRDGGEVVI